VRESYARRNNLCPGRVDAGGDVVGQFLAVQTNAALAHLGGFTAGRKIANSFRAGTRHCIVEAILVLGHIGNRAAFKGQCY